MTREYLGPSIENQEASPEVPKFAEGSLGFPLNEYLEGRERPLWLFERGVDKGGYGGLFLPPGLTTILRQEGVTTITSLLSKSKDDLLELQGIGQGRLRRIERRVERFFEHLKKTPEMEFLEVIFGLGVYPWPGEEMQPLSADGEKRLKGDIQEAFSFLNEREADILTQRFGFRNWWKSTYKVIGNRYGVTGNRARQIEHRALRKLRHPKISRGFRKYLPSRIQESLLRRRRIVSH